MARVIAAAPNPSGAIPGKTPAWRDRVFANMASLDRKGRVKGPTISKDENGGGLSDKLKRFLGVFKHLRLWDDD